MSIVVEHDPTVASDSERQALTQIAQMVASSSATEPPRIVGADGTQVALPQSVIHLLGQLAHSLAHDRPVTLVTYSRDLTTQQAADILNVSRPFLVQRLLNTGEIPYTMTGAHRRIACEDLMAYKRRRDITRTSALRELSRTSQQMDLE